MLQNHRSIIGLRQDTHGALNTSLPFRVYYIRGETITRDFLVTFWQDISVKFSTFGVGLETMGSIARQGVDRPIQGADFARQGWERLVHLFGRDEGEDDLRQFADAGDRVEVGLAERTHRQQCHQQSDRHRSRRLIQPQAQQRHHHLAKIKYI